MALARSGVIWTTAGKKEGRCSTILTLTGKRGGKNLSNRQLRGSGFRMGVPRCGIQRTIRKRSLVELSFRETVWPGFMGFLYFAGGGSWQRGIRDLTPLRKTGKDDRFYEPIYLFDGNEKER